jgi:transposase
MAKRILRDELWEVVEPLLPPEPDKSKGGRPRTPNRAALTSIIFALKPGLPWEHPPPEVGCGSGFTCWRRLHEWQKASVLCLYLLELRTLTY